MIADISSFASIKRSGQKGYASARTPGQKGRNWPERLWPEKSWPECPKTRIVYLYKNVTPSNV